MIRRSRRDALFVPDWRAGNPYMERLSTGLQRKGYTISFDHFPSGYMKLTRLATAHPTVGTIHLHWLSKEFIDQLFWDRNKVKFRVRLLVLLLDIVLCRARGIRIFWTLHNLVEHESQNPNQEIRVRALVARFANAVIVHSQPALDLAAHTYHVNLDRNGHVVPHGNYIDAYTYNDEIKRSLQAKYGIRSRDTVLLFFGAVRRYKGLDLLLSAFGQVNNERLRLIIAGKPIDEELRHWLVTEAAADSRIGLCLEFVPEIQVAAYFGLASAVILPLQGALTSGSVILAMSCGKCLILPNSARILGVPGNTGAFYYEDRAALVRLLQGLHEHQLDLENMGANNLLAAKRLDWDAIAAATARLYAGS